MDQNFSSLSCLIYLISRGNSGVQGDHMPASGDLTTWASPVTFDKVSL